MFPTDYFPTSYFPGDYFPPAEAAVGLIWANAKVLGGADSPRITPNTQLTTAALPPGSIRLFIKAFDTSGNESANSATFDIEITNENDIIFDQTEEPRWEGTLTNFVKHDVSGSLVPDSQNLASADDFDTFDIFVPNPFEIPIYEAVEVDLGFDSAIRIYAELVGFLGPGETGVADPILAIDYKTELGAYNGFEDWGVGIVTARFVKFRTKIDTGTGVAAVSNSRYVLDVQERMEGADSITIASGGGTAITFTEAFHLKPRVVVTADASTALIATKKNVTTTGFTAQVWDTDGNDVGGTIDWTAEGA